MREKLQMALGSLPGWCRFLVAAVLVFLLGFGCGYYRRAHVHDQSERAGRVEQQLDDLEKANEKSQTELSELRSELATSKKELNEARKQSTELMNELQQLRSQSQSQQVRLKNVNESLKQFAKEEQRTRLRIKAQRNTWEAIAAGLLVAWTAK